MKLMRRIDRVLILVLIGIGIAALTMYAIFGKTIRTKQPPMIAYLGNPLDAPEIWMVRNDGRSLRRLTATGGTVRDFSVAPDGDKIVYSVHEMDGSSSLYLIGTSGGDAEMLIDCGNARCEKPVWSNDGRIIAYSQVVRIDKIATRIVAIYPIKGTPAPAVSDIFLRGTNPVFSPDSQKLAVNSPEQGFIRILDLSTGIEQQVPTSTPDPVTWALDSKYLYFNENLVIGVLLQSRLHRVELATMQIDLYFPDLLSGYDAAGLVFSPDGEWAALGLRVLDYQAGRQIFISKVDGSQFQAVSDDPGSWHTAVQWSPNGSQLVFQRYTPGSSNAVPQVVVWERTSNQFTVIAENAALPAWVP